MDKTIIIGLINNTAILLAFSMIYDYSWIQGEDSKSLSKKVITGFIIGAIGLLLMLTPWKQVPGLVFDTRSVLLSLSGLFFGAIPAAVAVIITGIYRATVGGPGVWMGLAVIASSATIGVIWRVLNRNWNKKNYLLNLVGLGFTVHLVMLACTFLLPEERIKETLRNIVIPLLTIYPAGTILLGLLMARQLKNRENRKASEKLRESERRFSEMMKNTLLFSAIIDAKGEIIFCNDQIIKTTGFSPDELTGKNVFEVFIPEKSSEAIRSVFSYIMKGQTGYYNYETELKIKDGSNIIVSWNGTVLKNEFGEATGIALIGENISARKKAEAELIRAKTKAEESDKLKSIFLSNMSHEIRTPMNAIMGFSALLGEDQVSKEDRNNYIEIIRNSGDRLLQILNDIIDISKLEAGQLRITPSECSLNAIIRNSIDTFGNSELMKRKPDLKLICNISEANEDLRFMYDPHRLRQILDNLLSNAIKYTEKGTVEIGYKLTGINNEKSVEFYIADTGIGIPPQMAELIFERFRQVEEGHFHEGAGLGLSITKGITLLMGGKIWFTSEAGKGTTFYLTLPYYSAPNVVRPQVAQVHKPPDLKGKTVLIAEDDYNSFYYLRLMMEELNATTLHAENGEMALRLIKHKTPDLILLDINMPVLSGFDCLEEMMKAGIKTAVIAQTAYAMPDEREKCLNLGCDGYIAKPVRKTELYSLISEITGAKNNSRNLTI